MALSNFFILVPPLKNISGGEHRIKRALSNVTASVAQEKRIVKLLKMDNGMNYYVPVQQDEAPSYKKQRDE